MFKKLIIRIIAIFIGLFATFTIENGREKNDEILLIEGIIQSLRVDIVDNIDYSKEHLRQLENMIYLSKKILDKFEDLEVKEVYQYHNEAPFLHRFNINGEIKYIVEDYDSIAFEVFFSVWNSWNPSNIYFKSILNSGTLLKIQNDKLRREIESIYTRQEERMMGLTLILSNHNKRITDWFYQKELLHNSAITQEEIFIQYRDYRLKKELKLRLAHLEERVLNLKNYIYSLENVCNLIDTEDIRQTSP